MAKFTLEIPDDLIADALAAWGRLMDRREVSQRQPLTIDAAWAATCCLNNLGGIIQADLQQTKQEEATAAGKAEQIRLAKLIQAAGGRDHPGPVT